MGQKKQTTAIYCREVYEDKVALEALARAGRCPNLKGVAHEILVRDKINVSLDSILNGKRAVLTQSKTAPVKDLMIMRGNKVAGHMQLKDTISSAGARKTAKQILSGKYDKTTILGTDETIEAVAKISRQAAKRMKSSGISSSTTARIAQHALGTMPSAGALMHTAKSGGAAGAYFGAGMEAVFSTIDCMRGKKSVGNAVGDVTVSAIKGGMTGAGASVANSVGSALVGHAVRTFATTTLGSVLSGTAIGGMIMTGAPVIGGFLVSAYAVKKISSVFNGL